MVWPALFIWIGTKHLQSSGGGPLSSPTALHFEKLIRRGRSI